MELVLLPTYKVHPYFSLIIWAKQYALHTAKYGLSWADYVTYLSQFPHLKNEDSICTYLIRLLWRLNESAYVNGSELVSST